MLVSDAAVVVARAIKKDGVCDFHQPVDSPLTSEKVLRKCRHCYRQWERGEVAAHSGDCPVLAAEMILANQEAAPGIHMDEMLGHEMLGRLLVVCVEKLGGEIEFTGEELDRHAGQGLGLLPNKSRTGLVMSIMTREEFMGR